MPKPAEILLERIDRRLAEQGLSRWELSMRISDRKQHGIITDIERKGTMPGAARLHRIAEELATTTDWLLGRTESPEPVRSEVTIQDMPHSLRDQRQGWRTSADDRIPVLGTAYCDDLVIEADGENVEIERIMLETDHTVQMIARPPALWNAQDAYAIYFHGSSMEPRYYQGELGVVDPRRPPGPGDFVVVQLNDGESDDVVTVLVKQLVRMAATQVELRQFNPDQTFNIPRSRVARMHRIVSPNELYG